MADDSVMTYPEDTIFYDYAYLQYLLKEERDASLITYVEQHFNPESHPYQIFLMLNYPFFANKILDNYEMSNDDKQDKFLRKLTYKDRGGGKIILVDGMRGGGKSSFGCWVLNEYHKISPNICFFFVTKAENRPQMPEWIEVVKDITQVPNNSVALIDEGAIQLNSRRAMTKTNIDASERLVILRHKNISLIILVQNVLMVDANVRRLADIRVLKHGIIFGTERKQRGDIISKDLELIRNRLRPRNFTEAYIEIASDKIFMNFTHTLPEWWDDEKTSKSFKDVDMNKVQDKKSKKKEKEEKEDKLWD